MIRIVTSSLGGVVLLGILAFAQSTSRNTPAGNTGADSRDWPVYGGNQSGTRYSTLTQINRSNVSQLQVAWQFDPMDMPANAAGRGNQQTSPLVIGGVVYAITPGGNLVALDGASGAVRWSFHSNGAGQRSRGLAYWTDGKERRILAGFGRYIYAVDADTGRQVQPFGREGRIDLHLDLGRDPNTNTMILSTPGVVYRDTYIVGGRTAESLPTFPGDIRAYDIRTGQLKWSFHTIPHPGEYGYETWPKEAWTYIGSANNWAGMALDERRGIVYVPTGSPAADFYGGNRLGDGLFGNTLLALNAETGKRIWHFQAVKHDTWDRDLDSPPVLVTVRRNGRNIDAVAQASKQGFLFVFDRETGEPLFPIEHRRVPPAVVPDDVAAETQPFPLKPAPFARTLLTEDMLSRRTPEVYAWALERFKTFRSEGQFVPLSVGKDTVIMPGFDGGAEYGGNAFDPQSGNLYINANDLAWTTGLRENDPNAAGAKQTYANQCASCHGADMTGGLGPSLLDLRTRRSNGEVGDVIRDGSGTMPPFALPEAEHDALVQFLMTGAATQTALGGPSPAFVKYSNTGLRRWLDPDGYPAVAPPWGTLNAINLNTGEYSWKVSLGEYPSLVARGMKDTGSENYGGPIVTAGGLVFIGATVYDKKIRAFDKDNGTLLWESTMVNSAYATPVTYEANGRQFVVIGAFGGRLGAGPEAGPSRLAGPGPAGGRGAGPAPARGGRGRGGPPRGTAIGAGATTGGAFVAFALPAQAESKK